MRSLVSLCFILTSVSTFSLVSRKSRNCKTIKGLPCGSFTRLELGDTLKVSSKVCRDGRYPSNEDCQWKFEVGSRCLPRIQCRNLNILGNWKRGCRRDRLRVETENVRFNWCGRRRKVEYKESKSTYFLDLRFTTDRKEESTGFSCSVSCNPAPEVPTSPPNQALAQPWSGCRCGVANTLDKIVGGEESLEHQYPWQVGLTNPRARTPWCGGSLLSSRTVLTAAHCVQSKRAGEVVVVVGDHDLRLNDGEVRHAVCKVTVHPQYRSQNNNHDLALLTLCLPVQWRPEVQPVCLPPPVLPPASISATVTGWGLQSQGGTQPERLQAVSVTTLNNTACNQAYGGGVITDSMFCARDEGKDACQGDSGGPIVTQMAAGKAFMQIGLVSWGVGCAHPQYPGVYTSLSSHLQFIRDNMRGQQCQAP